MGFWDFFKSKNKTNMQMVEFANKWSDIYLQNHAIKKNDDVKNAALIFCSWAVWDYCMNNDMLPKGNKNDVANNFIATVCAFVSNTHEIDVLDFVELYKNRFGIYKMDIRGLLNSHYPQTRQYIPTSLYVAFYKKVYTPFTDPGISFIDEDEQIMDFVGKFIPFWNKLNKAMMNNEI